MSKIQISIPEEDITAFCQRWSITEIALFGSILRDDFNSKSDVDLLVSRRGIEESRNLID